MLDILLFQAFISNSTVTIKIVARFWCLYCRVDQVFKHVNANLRSRVMGRERKTDPASSARTSRKGRKYNYNRLLSIVNNFCIPFGTKIKKSICGGIDSDCTE